ncbi:UDP-glucose dehydrogenase family protein [Undibacterium fentianense]|uniref:UDP-glucose 6-dehydrogenase n=1 Tax=Undibacterium fentianense TaxID=2828728 RepID=A0A941E237_9BURK|nr:UDP-glucose/GDP-mannose dehydrogenase family protein [Undibacterium fentianense]MBR7799971.1 UDP-glucose/GDP-mannose dehydrogenase family protein [Undibacterium fentianense]
MKITIIGTGYVGLVTGACLAEVGHDVFCLDVDQRKIDILNGGGIPIHEPGLDQVVTRNVAAGRLHFSTDVIASVAHGDVQFIAVGTPPDEDGSADLQYVLAAARNIGKHMSNFKVIVDKSTVPVGTADRVSAVIADELKARSSSLEFAVTSNPEFLKEGAAVADFMKPDRLVIGHGQDAQGTRAQIMLREVYSSFENSGHQIYWMDVRSAEFTKYAANAMLATRISFMNELANLADKVGVDIDAVRKGIGSDPRIGPGFLMAGCGYGGSCFPKDVQALVRTAQEFGHDLKILQAVEEVNEQQKHVLVSKIFSQYGSDLRTKQFALWGLAFKPDTDDMRAASSRVLIKELLLAGASIVTHDPVAMDEAQRVLALDFVESPDLLKQIRFENDAMQALDGADALIIVTEWKVFRNAVLSEMKQRLKHSVIFDGRNLYDPREVQALGIEYHPIGRAVLTKFLQK